MEPNQPKQLNTDPFKKVEPPHKDFLQRHQIAGYIFVGVFIALAILLNYKMRIYREMMDVNIPPHEKAIQAQKNSMNAEKPINSNYPNGN